jgi:hypothetical protein
MICDHKLPALLTITKESVVTPQYFGVSMQQATRTADYAPSTTLPIHDPLNERGVVELAGGDSRVSRLRPTLPRPSDTAAFDSSAGQLRSIRWHVVPGKA